MISWGNGWAGHAERWVWIGLLCSMLLSITWATQYMLIVLSNMVFFERFNLMLAIEKHNSFASFLINIDALMGYFLHTPRSVWTKVTWLNAGQTRRSYKQNGVKWFQSAVKHSSMYMGKSLATFSRYKFLILSESHFHYKLKRTVS